MSLPSRRDRFKPLELIGLAGALAVVAALVVLMVSRDIQFTLITLGVVFVICIVFMATFVLLAKPNKAELADIERLDAEDHH